MQGIPYPNIFSTIQIHFSRSWYYVISHYLKIKFLGNQVEHLSCSIQRDGGNDCTTDIAKVKLQRSKDDPKESVLQKKYVS